MNMIQRFCALPPEARAALYTFLLDLATACAQGERTRWIQTLQEVVHNNLPELPDDLRQERAVAAEGTQSGRIIGER